MSIVVMKVARRACSALYPRASSLQTPVSSRTHGNGRYVELTESGPCSGRRTGVPPADDRETRKEFREPVALSSAEPADFPLPRTALELGFDLLALRAPCRRERSGS